MQSGKNNELYNKLIDSYTDLNLNKIAHNLIRLYRDKQFDKLQVIAEMVSGEQSVDSITEKQGFSKLISIYHPDRIQYYRNELDKYASTNDHQILHRLEHILSILDIEEIVANIESYEDIDYSPEFVWDIDENGFTFFDVTKKSEFKQKHKTPRRGYTFYDAMKTRLNGNINLDFPFYYFEDMEEVEISQSQINNLDGVEFCIHAINLDLSGNLITDITPLFELKRLEEINLSDNQITDIDALGNLPHLRSIDLSNNPINDLTPLFDLDLLEYIDISRNHASPMQIKLLEEKGVTVNIVD